MADLNGGKGKFWGVDGSVKYADSFVGATKVAEKVKKGGTEKKSDGYVVDAIDIDWGGLKLTTIADQWQQGMQTVSSTEQNAGKGEHTQGIHSTAYLLNLISSSFTQIYNEIGGSDNAGLRKKIKELDTAIKQMSNSTPGQLAEIKANIEKINNELADPGATGTLVTILDTLDGFDKNKKGDVKDYIDTHDQAILGSTADAATAYTVYGVRKYVDTTAKTNLIGKKGDKWDAQKTLYGVVEYVDTTAKDRLIGTSADTTIDTHYGLKHILIGNTADTTINTHWGIKNSLLGATGDSWLTKQTIYSVKDYADEMRTASYAKAEVAAGNVLGKSGDLWPTQHTVYGVAKYAENLASSSYTAVGDLEDRLIGASTDAATADTIWGAKNYANTTVKNSLLGASGDSWLTKQTIYSVKDYADGVQTASYAKAEVAAGNVLGKDGDLWPTQHTVYGVAKYATTVKNSLLGASGDQWSTKQTIWGAKNYADGVKNSLLGASGDSWLTKQTIYSVKDYADGVQTASYAKAEVAAGNVLGKSSDLWPNQHTVYGVAKYADEKIKTLSNTAFKVSRIEDGGEGILVFSTVS